MAAAGCRADQGGEASRLLRTDGRPNVVVIVTDDQGYGDLGWTGNPVLRTPNLDRVAREGVVMERFYATPVCAPTRASLLTGRYAYRTRVVDTYRGRAILDPDEVTLAERLSAAGYRCGAFGKWHLGDNAPSRPSDQGFEEVLVHRGGGIGQESDPPGGSSYYDPLLFRNGRPERTHGYCTDVITDAALRFIESHVDRPFYVHLAYNVPHVPLEIRDGVERWIERVRADRVALRVADDPVAIETTARIYAMVETVDRNVGRLLERLRALGLDDSTLVIFLTDNGPQQPRWNAGFRGLKGSVHEGGIRVPLAARWPGRLPAGRRVIEPAAVIDLLPTILDACDVEAVEAGRPLDGRSLWPLWTGQEETIPERLLFVQWHRGDVPQEGRACAVVGDRWKLVQAAGVPERGDLVAAWALFDLSEDPGETRDVSAEHPEVVTRLRESYRAWFRDVTRGGFAPVRIWVGSDSESPLVLTRQDRRERGTWKVERGTSRGAGASGASRPLPGPSLGGRGDEGRTDQDGAGWYLEVVRAGRYRVDAVWDGGVGRLDVEGNAGSSAVKMVEAGDRTTRGFVWLEMGPVRIDAVQVGGDGTEAAARYVRIERVGEATP